MKYRTYRSSHNRRVVQEARNKIVKEEVFREFEMNINHDKNMTPSTTRAKDSCFEESKEGPKISDKEKNSIKAEKEMIQQLMNSDLEIIKQAQNKMVEISMLIRQFSVKSLEQRELTEISNNFPNNI